MRSEGKLRKSVFVVHQIVERKPGEWARRGQFLEKGPMSIVRRIIVAAPAKVSAARPWLESKSTGLVTSFGRERVCVVRESPNESIEFATHAPKATMRAPSFALEDLATGDKIETKSLWKEGIVGHGVRFFHLPFCRASCKVRITP